MRRIDVMRSQSKVRLTGPLAIPSPAKGELLRNIVIPEPDRLHSPGSGTGTDALLE